MEDKVLGKLIVIESNDPECPGSHLAGHGIDDNGVPRFVLAYCPNASESTGVDGRDARSIIAHELGHFLGQILDLPNHKALADAEKQAAAMSYSPFDYERVFNRLSRPLLLPEEREAWDIAETIAPGSSTSPTAQYALKSYETSK